jgi:alpha-glucosidase
LFGKKLIILILTEKTMNTKLTNFLMATILFSTAVSAQRPVSVLSPDNNIRVEITAGQDLTYRVFYKNQEVLGRSAIKMILDDGRELGSGMRISRTERKTVNEKVRPLYGISNEYINHYNLAILHTRQQYAVEFRVFNDAVSYRFVTRMPGTIKVKDEVVEASFPTDPMAWFHIVPSLEHSSEQNYTYQPISALDSAKLTSLPILIEAQNVHILFTEADLLDYAGLHLTGDGSRVLKGKLANFVTKTRYSGWNSTAYNNTQLFVEYNQFAESRADFLAETSGTRTFPWRVMILKENVIDMMNTPVVYLLATPGKIGDESWIKPGTVLWDWWCAVNLQGVDFKAGFNTETFKYYIDFAAEHNIPYVNLDEWWSAQDDLLAPSDELDMEFLTRYAREKNVGLFLWCIWHVLDRQMIPALDKFRDWGIAGIKVDFMDRDDQYVVNFYERVAAEAASRKILVNFHGAMKPTGLERTYPNILNREAVLGLEYDKFSDKCTPEHNVTIPFIRMAVGAMDYTPGAMYNGTATTWRQVMLRPMSQSTRAQQLAMFVAYFAPLQMIADAPTEYLKEPEILEFISGVPVVWDETLPLDGKIGEYVTIARRSGDTWYVGVLNNSEPRTLEIPLGKILNSGNYNLTSFADGANADRIGTDYRHEQRTVNGDDILVVELAPGGGWVGVISQ